MPEIQVSTGPSSLWRLPGGGLPLPAAGGPGVPGWRPHLQPERRVHITLFLVALWVSPEPTYTQGISPRGPSPPHLQRPSSQIRAHPKALGGHESGGHLMNPWHWDTRVAGPSMNFIPDHVGTGKVFVKKAGLGPMG